MFKTFRRFVFFFVVFIGAASSIFAFAQTSSPTLYRTSPGVEVSANGAIIVKANGGWGVSCNGNPVDYVYFDKTNVPAYNSMLAVVMGAYFSNKKMLFYGNCAPDLGNRYWRSSYVSISD